MTPHPIPVSVSGWTLTAVFSALGTFVEAVIGGGFLVALVKVWPRLKELTIGQRKDDLTDMRKRISDLETKADAAIAAANKAQMQLVYAVNAVLLVIGRLEVLSPNDPVIKQARDQLAAATSGGVPGIADALMKGLHEIREKGE